MLKVTGDHSLFFLLFLYSFLFRIGIIYYHNIIVTFVFGVFPCHWLFSVLTHFRLMGPGIEMQLSGYHGCWGCRITMVDCMKDLLYSRSLCTGKYQMSWRWISFFIVILTVIDISDAFYHFRNSWDIGRALYNKSALPLGVGIE